MLSGNFEDMAFLYNGQYGVMSDDNGLYYMRARYYNIDIKRFINQDILTGTIDSSQSLNRYAYVEGNPVSYLDPFGLEPLLTDGLHFGAALLMLASSPFIKTPMGMIVFVGAFGFDTGVYINDIFTSHGNFEVVSDMIFSTLLNVGGFTLSKALMMTKKTSKIITIGGKVDVASNMYSVIQVVFMKADEISNWIIKQIDTWIEGRIRAKTGGEYES